MAFDVKEISNVVLELLCSGILDIRNSSNKRHIRTAALIRGGGGHLLTFFVPNVVLIRGQCLFGGSTCTMKYGR